MWYRKNFFQYATGTILVFLIIYLAYTLAPLLTPAFNFGTTIAVPLIISGLLYYLLKPYVNFLNNKGIPRRLAIIIVFAVIVLSIFILGLIVYPVITTELSSFSEVSTGKLEEAKEKTASIISFLNFKMYSTEEIKYLISVQLQKLNSLILQNIVDIVTNVTKIAVVLLITPFVLFYLLKDDQHFYSYFLKNFPDEFTNEAKKFLDDIDETLLRFINGQVLVSISVGVLLYIGYVIIGLKHAMLLALFAMIFNTIPFLGAFIAIIPALFVGMSMDSLMTFKVILTMLLAHLIDANFISPVIMSQKLNIHPLTIVLLLLASGSLYGVVGLLLATPIYAIAKVLAYNLYKIFMLRYNIRKKEQQNKEEKKRKSVSTRKVESKKLESKKLEGK